jgi:hypothetical protein
MLIKFSAALIMVDEEEDWSMIEVDSSIASSRGVVGRNSSPGLVVISGGIYSSKIVSA